MTSEQVGFTGTQRGMTEPQAVTVLRLLSSWTKGWLHHGDCIGADAHAHWLARHVGWSVAIHPPVSSRKRAFCTGAAHVYDPLDYLARNRMIVTCCDVLLATPSQFTEQLRSGTWSTIRRARKERTPIVIVTPDGTARTEKP